MSSFNNSSALESYSWSELYNNPSDSAPSVPKSGSLSAAEFAGPNAIPVIDMADPDALRLLSLACESWGAFQVIGHGIPHRVLENMSTEVRHLFALPTEEKMKIAHPAGSTQTTGSMEGYGCIPLQSFFTKQFWSEGLMTKSKSATHQMASKLWLDGSNFCNAVEEYRDTIKSLSTKLVKMMLLSLGLTEADIKRADPLGLSQKEPERILRLNWYPACPEPEREMGMPHHTDSGILAVIYSTTTGLQVLKNEDMHGPARWVNVQFVPDSLVVLVGDLGHILSNGRFHNVMHRAMVNPAEPRFSVIYLWAPGESVVVSPLVSGIMGKPVYPALRWSEFAAIKLKMFYKALDSIKLTEVEEDKKDRFAYEVAEEKRDGSASYLEEEKNLTDDPEKKDDSTVSEVEKEKGDGSAAEVEKEKGDGSASYLEKEKNVSEVEGEKKDGSAASEMEEEVSNVVQEKKNGSTASEMEGEKKNGSASEMEEEEKKND